MGDSKNCGREQRRHGGCGLGFGASRLALGLIQGGKAAFFSITAAAVEDKTEETAVAATNEATQKLVSAFAALRIPRRRKRALGWKPTRRQRQQEKWK